MPSGSTALTLNETGAVFAAHGSGVPCAGWQVTETWSHHYDHHEFDEFWT
jgi:hypothetical protein